MWSDFGTYYVLNTDQRSDIWFKARKYRITASRCFNTLVSNRYSNQDEYLLEICDLKPKQEMNAHMFRGIVLEEPVCKWFEKEYSQKVTHIGLCVPKWCQYISASPDGLLQDDEGIIEIKCVSDLNKEYRANLHRVKSVKDDYDYIDVSHFNQMQLCMAVLNRSYCIYIVCCVYTGEIYVEKIPFFPSHFQDLLYPAILKFINVKLINKLVELNVKPIYPDTISDLKD